MPINVLSYSPICVPMNWQTERLENSEERLHLIKELLSADTTLSVLENPWPTGYGSLAFDNLPVLYQPAAVIKAANLLAEPDVIDAAVYCYDNCLAVLFVELKVQENLDTLNDIQVTRRIEELSQTFVSPILERLYTYQGGGKLIAPQKYQFFVDTKETLCNAKPLWVARTLVKLPELEEAAYFSWLKNIDERSNTLLLGSGNSLILDSNAIEDVHRVMVLSQFQSALMARVEDLLKRTLKDFNAAYFDNAMVEQLNKGMAVHQQRNDHIEFINIQFSASAGGMQGIRRSLLSQFQAAWLFDEQQGRIDKLSSLIQERLNRSISQQLSRQNRGIQTLLTFLGSLGLVGLVVDLISLNASTNHISTRGLLDIVSYFATENLLSITLLLVVVFTWYFYKNHK
ncbi:hypothetical protein ACOI22_10710 [Glaciecola sp. 2405UD65-10]|uniref:hypothetical protein n=1 Tax=Glaciecola sp. 2405UD65-10 TaxID=3397244 RepID=UPI003B5A1576